ncbi:MAG TPA: phage tail tube protein [Patescibacteria group bacterium]|jgi:hypothetical protein|nr:phage tail tube protein [Patescibacteria group bacterium]
MATNVGRKGWLGLAYEPTPGVPVSPTDYLAFTSNTMHGMQKPIDDVTARGIRDQQYNSVLGKKWSEGDIDFHLDPSISGYFLGAALGTNAQSALGGGVFSHAISRNNANQPLALTLTNSRVVDQEYFRGCVVDSLEFKAADQWIDAKATMKGFFPQTSVSGTGTTVSGTLLTWAQYTTQFGVTVAAATGNAATKMSDFSLKINNNVEPTFRSGANEPATIDVKDFNVGGSYTVFFENTTDKNTYYNLTKNALVFTATGNGIGAGFNESIVLNLYQVRLDAFVIETGIDAFYAEKVNFIGEYNSASAKTIDGTIQNRNSNY